MKKILFLASLAAVAMTSCTSESNEYVGDNTPKEIAFFPVNQMATRAAVQSAVFPIGNTMEVACYESAPNTPRSYFSKMTFKKDGSENVWRGWNGSAYAPKYWPLSPVTLNFFAISAETETTHITIADNLATASVAYTTGNSFSATSQKDIMYAFNRGSVTLSGNTLSYPGDISMVFGHALALVNFQIKAKDDASTAIKIKKIELNGANYTGTVNFTNTNASAASGAFSTQIDWTGEGVVDNVQVPNIGNTSSPVALTTSFVPVADATAESEGTARAALMIVPKQQKAESPVEYGFKTFTITYVLDSKEYTYTYAPAGYTSDAPNLTVVEAGKMYTYQITMALHEIRIAPTVTQWVPNDFNTTTDGQQDADVQIP